MTKTKSRASAPAEDAPRRVLDVHGAAKLFEGLFDDNGKMLPAAKPPADPDDDDDAGEDPADDNDDDKGDDGDDGDDGGDGGGDGGDDDGDAAVAPPVAWSATDKAEFAKLPPPIQAIVARREGERDRAFSLKTQDAAVQHRAVLDQAQRLAAHQQQLDGVIAQGDAGLRRDVAGVDWPHLAQHNPAGYAQAAAAVKGRQAQLDQLRQRRLQLGQLAQRQQAELQRTQLANTHDQLRRINPAAFADPAKAREELGRVKDYATSLGIQDADVLRDHRAILLLQKARAYDALAAKRQPPAKTGTAPRTVAPGADTGAQGPESRARRIAGLRSKLSKSGSVADAARLLESMME